MKFKKIVATDIRYTKTKHGKIYVTVYAEKAGRSKTCNIFLPVLYSALIFLPWRKHIERVVHTKNHRLRTKTFCLA